MNPETEVRLLIMLHARGNGVKTIQISPFIFILPFHTVYMAVDTFSRLSIGDVQLDGNPLQNCIIKLAPWRWGVHLSDKYGNNSTHHISRDWKIVNRKFTKRICSPCRWLDWCQCWRNRVFGFTCCPSVIRSIDAMRLSLSIYKRITASLICYYVMTVASLIPLRRRSFCWMIFLRRSLGWSRSCRDLLSTASNTTRPRRLCHQDDANKSFSIFFSYPSWLFLCVCVCLLSVSRYLGYSTLQEQNIRLALYWWLFGSPLRASTFGWLSYDILFTLVGYRKLFVVCRRR